MIPIINDTLIIIGPLVIGMLMGMFFEHKYTINEIEQIKSDIECLKNDMKNLYQHIEVDKIDEKDKEINE